MVFFFTFRANKFLEDEMSMLKSLSLKEMINSEQRVTIKKQ